MALPEVTAPREAIAIASGGPIADFAGGWAVAPMIALRAHWWRRGLSWTEADAGEIRGWKSLCGLDNVTYARVPALAEGSAPRCRNCARIAVRQKLT
jgi:hypothetical protein